MPGMQVPAQFASLPRLNDEEFAIWARLLQERTGIQWPLSRKSFLETQLRMRMRELGLDDFRDLRRHLLGNAQGGAEWAILVDRLTIHETRFFRHPPSLRVICGDWLPRRRPAAGDSDDLLIWSVGCATGEEPYSLAIVLSDHLRTAATGGDFRILASDISLPALQVARQGIYMLNKVREIPLSLRVRYIAPLGNGRYQVHPELRRRVYFVQANAIHGGHTALGKVDLIVCQNLLIYFSREQRVAILNRLVEHLVPGGGLVLGPGEVLNWMHPEMERIAYPNTLAFRHT